MIRVSTIRWLLIRAVWVAALVGWFVWLRPQPLGGPAAYLLVSGSSMEPAYHAGDLVVVERSGDYSVGDIIAYTIPDGAPAAGFEVIHRIVGGDAQNGFVMHGDNTNGPDQWHPTSADVLGREMFFIPRAGTVLLLLRSPVLLGGLAAVVTVILVLAPARRARAHPAKSPPRARPRWLWGRRIAPG